MKKLVAALILSICFNAICSGACTEQIRKFYTAYLQNMLEDDAQNTALCAAFFTEELQQKVHRMRNATGADPVIRAQDTNRDAIETLSVEDLGGDWYRVSYLWEKGDSATLTQIPLKARIRDGSCKIVYITPPWNGTRYGNEMLTVNASEHRKIDRSSGLSFLKSFYEVYTAEYCRTPEDLAARLLSLRSEYLSQNALDQFTRTERENSLDGVDGYDLVIGNFDFDCLWRKSLSFIRLNENTYQVTYRAGDTLYGRVVTLRKKNGAYVIDSFAG